MYIGPVVVEVDERQTPPLRSRASYTVRHRFEDSLQAHESTRLTTSAPSVQPSTYTVRSGDTLTAIVQAQLKAAGRPAGASDVYEQVRKLATHNGLRDADRLQVGQQLDLAPLFGGTAARPLNTPPAAAVIEPPASIKSSALAAPATIPGVNLPTETAPTAASGALSPTAHPVVAKRDSIPAVHHNRGKVFRHVSRDTNAAERLAALKMPDSDRPFVLVAADSSADGKGGPAPDQPVGMTLKHYREPGNLVTAMRRALHPGPMNTLAAAAESIAEAQEPSGGTESTSALNAVPVAAALHAPARITSGYGMRRDPFNGRPAFHRGVDLAVKSGTDIYPVKEGVVKFSGWQPGYGRMVIVQHEDGLETVYAHNSSNLVQPGERVSPDAAIAKSGSSGRSTGPHLHFEVREGGKAVDPMPHLHQH